MKDTDAVFFDVDFTLIHPGPRFQGSGYASSCARRGIVVDISRFESAVREASSVLDSADQLYDNGAPFIRYTARIIELMGGQGDDVAVVARELYDEWSEHRHFSLYEDVRDTLEELARRRVRLGLISNTQRCLTSFRSHFALDDLISVTVSSAELGVMKPHRAIFQAALDRMQVPAERAVMVGDSVRHDVHGARQVGMHGVWLARGADVSAAADVPTIRSLRELPQLLE